MDSLEPDDPNKITPAWEELHTGRNSEPFNSEAGKLSFIFISMAIVKRSSKGLNTSQLKGHFR